MKGAALLLFLVFVSVAWASSVENVRIALAGDVSQMSVVWITSKPTRTSEVRYGESPDALSLRRISVRNQTSYATDAGWNHKLLMTGLKPATTYYYQVGDMIDGFSAIYSFTTRQQQFTSPYTIVAYGDMGVDNSNNTMTQLKKGVDSYLYDLVLHMGDISYANDHSDHYEATWTKWFHEMQPVMGQVPYMVAPGNHESVCKAIHCMPITANFTTYKEKFRMPGPESGSGTNMFYSFDYYNIHFIALSTESDFPGAPNLESAPWNPRTGDAQSDYFQINWLRSDLMKAVANRKEVPWIVVFGHRPIYAPLLEENGIPTGTSAAVQQFLEPLLKEFEVDVYLTGHVHAYLRTWPTYNNTVTAHSYDNPPSTVHICAGGAGNIEGISTFPDYPSWYAGGNDIDFGFGAFHVDPTQPAALTWNYYLSKNGQLNDTITITKSIN